MKKNKILFFTKILSMLFIIGTIIVFFIIYKDIDNGITLKFLRGYMILTFFVLIYFPIITIINLRKLKWVKIRRRFLKFLFLFLLFGALNYIFDYILRPTKIDLLREFSIAFGSAFGISFIDITFSKKDSN